MKNQLKGLESHLSDIYSYEARPRLANERDIFGKPIEDTSPRPGGDTPMELRDKKSKNET